MLERIKANLNRQGKGLDVLNDLLREEFSHLKGRRPQAVTKVEFAIQELMRQLAVERLELKQATAEIAPEAARLTDLVNVLEPAAADELAAILEELDRLEQCCAVQAEKNGQLAMALLDQSRDMLDFMTDQLKPKNTDTYSTRGRYADAKNSGSALFRGTI